MIEIEGRVVGSEAVVGRLATASDRIRARIRTEVDRLGIELQGKVRREYLTGQSLHVRSGRLRASINERLVDTGSTIEARVGTAVPYGRFWELGFTGVENVREFVRRQRRSDVMVSNIKSQKSRRIAQGIEFVRAHQRHVNVAPRPFLKPALLAMRPKVLEMLALAFKADTVF